MAAVRPSAITPRLGPSAANPIRIPIATAAIVAGRRGVPAAAPRPSARASGNARIAAGGPAGNSPGPTSWTKRKATAVTAPTPVPTSGKAQAALASGQLPRGGCGGSIATLVRKAVATAKLAKNPGGCRKALIAATI